MYPNIHKDLLTAWQVLKERYPEWGPKMAWECELVSHVHRTWGPGIHRDELLNFINRLRGMSGPGSQASPQRFENFEKSIKELEANYAVSNSQRGDGVDGGVAGPEGAKVQDVSIEGISGRETASEAAPTLEVRPDIPPGCTDREGVVAPGSVDAKFRQALPKPTDCFWCDNTKIAVAGLSSTRYQCHCMKCGVGGPYALTARGAVLLWNDIVRRG